MSTGATAIAAGDYHTCALKGGGVKCWGANNHGQLGDGTTASHGAPTLVSNLPSGVAAVAAGGGYTGGEHTCALLLGGAVQCRGDNAQGKLGDGTTTDRATPTQVACLMSGVTAVALGAYHGCALSLDGGVSCWGDNMEGELGAPTTTTSRCASTGSACGLTPIPVHDL